MNSRLPTYHLVAQWDYKLRPDCSSMRNRIFGYCTTNADQKQMLPSNYFPLQSRLKLRINVRMTSKLGGKALKTNLIKFTLLLFQMCEPVRKLPRCRYFRDITWTLVTKGDNLTQQIVHCTCPRDSVAYMIRRQAYHTEEDDQIGFKYSFACSPQSVSCVYYFFRLSYNVALLVSMANNFLRPNYRSPKIPFSYLLLSPQLLFSIPITRSIYLSSVMCITEAGLKGRSARE